MPHVRTPGDATARQVRQLTRKITASLTGRQRGPDREVRRDSYDVDDPKAKPWKMIGDGSPGQGHAHVGALLDVAEELRHQEWKEMPRADVRAAQDKRGAIAAELARYEAGEPMAVGWPATLRQELAGIDALLARWGKRLRRIDLTVLRGLLSPLDFRTGKLFPSYDEIAKRAGVGRTKAIESVARLKARGFLTWVRRSIRTGEKGARGQQRAQTSNAYTFDWRHMMEARVWQRFSQLLERRLRRLGRVPAALRPAPSTATMPSEPGLLRAVAGFGAAIDARDASQRAST